MRTSTAGGQFTRRFDQQSRLGGGPVPAASSYVILNPPWLVGEINVSDFGFSAVAPVPGTTSHSRISVNYLVRKIHVSRLFRIPVYW